MRCAQWGWGDEGAQNRGHAPLLRSSECTRSYIVVLVGVRPLSCTLEPYFAPVLSLLLSTRLAELLSFSLGLCSSALLSPAAAKYRPRELLQLRHLAID